MDLLKLIISTSLFESISDKSSICVGAAFSLFFFSNCISSNFGKLKFKSSKVGVLLLLLKIVSVLLILIKKRF